MIISDHPEVSKHISSPEARPSDSLKQVLHVSFVVSQESICNQFVLSGFFQWSALMPVYVSVRVKDFTLLVNMQECKAK